MLTYGIVLSGARLKTWHLRCIERLHQSKLASLRCVINDTSTIDRPAAQHTPYNALDAETYVDVEEIFARVPDAAAYHVRLSELLNPSPRFDVDFFISFGDERSAAPFCSAAPFGVWYFAHGDIARFTTAAPGFWELYRDDDVTAAYLLQMRNDGSAGVPLKRGFFPTLRHSFEKNAEAVLDAIVRWPQHVCWDITHGASEYFADDPIAQPPIRYGMPDALEVAQVRLREQRCRAAAYVREKFCTIEWTVARVKESPVDFIGAERRANVDYLYERNKSRYLADPCVVVRDERAYVFCEEYRRGANIGAVSVSEIGERGAHALRAAIEEPHHLSYPHIFEHGGQTYCVPESGGIRKVCLYRCVEFPDRWEYVHTLIDGFDAADSTIVAYGGRWWLFCTSSEAAAKGFYSHLYVWHAADLFGTWTQHVRNPVKIDARSSRPAGPFFVHEGRLYRPAQDCSRSYGGAVQINRVDKLSETEFEESVVGIIRPPRSKYTRGLHTLSAAGDVCVVDVERYLFDPLNARYTCTQAVKHALLRMGVSEDALDWMKRKIKSAQTPELQNAQPSEIEYERN